MIPRFSPLLVLALGLTSGLLRAEIKVDPAEVDLGRLRQEKTTTTTVTLTNAGAKSVVINRVTADCSCTAGQLSETTLAPGKSTKLEISFESRSYQGEVHRRVLLDTSEGDVFIAVKAVVSAFDHWLPGASVAILPPSNRGTSVSATLPVEYTGPANGGEVKSVETNASWLRAEIAERSGAVTKIKLTTLPTAPAGGHQPELRILTTDPKEPELKVPVFAAIYSNLTIKPSPILVKIAKVGEQARIAVQLAQWEGKDDPRCEVPNGEVKVSQRDKRDVLLALTVTATEPGTTTRVMHIYSGDSEEAQVPVIVRVEG